MTFLELYKTIRMGLRESGIEEASTEAAVLIEHYCGYSRKDLFIHGADREAAHGETERIFAAVKRRKVHYPLQYIIGIWPFMDLTLQVGEGVLIPREDTVVLVHAVVEYCRELSGNLLRGVDLCAGTGAVALSLCQILPDVSITAVEYFETAYTYLLRNLERYPVFMVKPLRGDILEKSLPTEQGLTDLDFIVSNPPYIAADELPYLQAEVKCEPKTALNGGQDGLVFYRSIAEIWVPQLKVGGLVALEIGETQAREVIGILEKSGVTDIQVHKDWAGLNRVVTGIKG